MNEVTHKAMAERVERRRLDPEFQAVLRRNLRQHVKLLKMLADG